MLSICISTWKEKTSNYLRNFTWVLLWLQLERCREIELTYTDNRRDLTHVHKENLL